MSKRILIIDDDEDILDILSYIFLEEGYEVDLYQTGTTADYIKILHPDLVLIDVQIKGFDKTGAEICAEIKTLLNDQSPPVILLSGEHLLEKIARECGADDYVRKPFVVDHLLNKVKDFII
jgi:two-component system response regulator VicR